MKKILYVCCIVGLIACNNNKSTTTEDFKETPTGLQGIQASGNTSATTQASANAGALNPAHGAPGHNCAIPVGAPLNSAPTQAQTAVQPQTTAQVQQNVIPVQANATAKVDAKGQKLNPAHGMPGHDCAIAVGAPLNTTTAQNNVVVPTPAAAAATSVAIPKFNEKGQKLNPEHGKPDHNCAIAVGAPLT